MGFTHFDEKGKAIMVDVTEKQDTVREATATGKITVNEEVFRAVKEGTAGKGDVLGVADNSRDYGSKEDIGSDSDVSHSSDHKVQGRVRDG